MNTSGAEYFAIYRIVFIVTLFLISVISFFVIVGIKKAQDENKKLREIQEGQLTKLDECLKVMTEMRDLMKDQKEKKE